MSTIETSTSDKLETLDCYQASCPPCRVMDRLRERLAQQYMGRLPVYRVDVERDILVGERFRVQSIPTTIVLHEGKEVERLDRLISDNNLKSTFERATPSRFDEKIPLPL